MTEKKEYKASAGRGPGHGPGRPMGGRAKDFRGTLKKLLAYCRSYCIPILISVICAAAGTIFTIIGPDKLSDLTRVIAEGLAGSIDMEAVSRIGFLLAALYLCGAALNFAQHFIMTNITQRLSRRMRSDICRKINRLPMSYFGRTFT